MPCACINQMNARLAERNGRLVTTLFGTPKAVIGSEKLDSKKRGQPPVAIASFCPFCGIAYAADQAPTESPPASPPDGAKAPPRPRTPENGRAIQTPEDGRPVHTR